MESIGIRDISKGLQALGLTRDSAAIVHTSLSSVGRVQGGSQALLAALLATCGTVVMPAFTYQCQVWPLAGPPDNGLTYGRSELSEANRRAVFFHPDLPVYPDIGVTPETLRQQPIALRSRHPVLSFVAAGRYAQEAIGGQTIEHPLAPIEWLQRHDGDVVLIGVGHRRNTSVHFAERLAGRKQFMRWALVRDDDGLTVRAMRLPNFPGCSEGFEPLGEELARSTAQVKIGNAIALRVPLNMLIPIVAGWISDDPAALLCDRPDCERCDAVRRSPRSSG